MEQPLMVFWCRNGRIGSLPLTDENREYMHRKYTMRLIQADATGTEHWSVLALRKDKDNE